MGTATEVEPVSLLRFATAGSVDDGKSTLVGRLLNDSKSLLADQLAAVETTSRDRGQDGVDLALLTDGLRAEREQGITIDVAYRYFATSRRRFILADTPGHVQYTRNMVTGASTADLTIILVDARHGMTEQTRRHLAVAALLRVPRVALAVNKMDLVDYAEEVFAAISAEVVDYATRLGIEQVTAIPISALEGDNVVHPSARMDWYAGPTVLEHLETVTTERPATEPANARFPVQYVLRAHGDGPHGYRGYAGQIASGDLSVGQRVVVLPTGRATTIEAIDLLGESVETASAPRSVALSFADELDVARGDVVVPAEAAVTPTQDVEATACHLDERPLRVGQRVVFKHGTRVVQAIVRAIPSRLTLDDLAQRDTDDRLQVNDIGLVRLRLAAPVPLDRYADSPATGAFLLIDAASGATLTAGMVGESGLAGGGIDR